MDDDLFTREYGSRRQEKDNLFGWTIFILLLIAVAFAAWFGSYYIFGQPENPRSYEILRKLDKIDPPRRFVDTKAPQGEFLTAEKLYDKYALYTSLELKRENDQLLRDFLKNYEDTKKLVPYIIGRFEVVASFELTEEDLFPTGVVALAVPEEFPRVVVEHLFPAKKEVVPMIDQVVKKGLPLRLQRTEDLSAVIHIERLGDGRLMFTAVPLLYSSYTLQRGQGGFSLEPPEELHLAAGIPILKEQAVRDALKSFVASRTSTSRETLALEEGPADAEPSPTPSEPELVRVEPVPTPTPASTVAIAATTPGESTEPAATPFEVAQNVTPTPPPAATATPQSTPAPGVELQPFLVAQPTPDRVSQGGGSWRVYEPGGVPPGRMFDVNRAPELATSGMEEGERLYLGGDFVVTASGGNRAVLRSRQDASAARVMVEYPSGSVPPREGERLARGEGRPFQIERVRRGEDGEVTIYVREITAGE